MNRVEVYICGKKFVLKSEESAEYIKDIARELDQKFNETFAIDGHLNLFDASVLVSLELLDELKHASKSSDSIRRQIKDYAEEAEKYRTEFERCQKSAEDLKEQAEDLKEQNENLQCQLDILSLQKKVTDLDGNTNG